MKSKPEKLKVPSLESVQKYLSGQRVDAETAAFGRKVEKLYVQYVSKHKGPKLRKLIEQDLATGASREQALEKAVKAGYLEVCADDILCEILHEEKETPMEVVSITAFAESMYGPDAPEHLQEAYFLAEAWEAAKRCLESKRTRTSFPHREKPPGRSQ